MASATLNDNVVFAVGSTGQDANAWRLYDAESGGNELWRDNLANDPDPLALNQFYRVEANGFVITQPVGTDGATEEFAKRELRGALGPTTWAQLYQGNAAVTGRAAISLALWTIA